MYLFAVSVFGPQRRWPALVAATAYMYAPYLLTNLYVRAAIAEVGAQAWLPWMFRRTRRLLNAEVHLSMSSGRPQHGWAGCHAQHHSVVRTGGFGVYLAAIWWRTGHPGPAWLDSFAIAAAWASRLFLAAPHG